MINAIYLYRFGAWLKSNKIPILPKLFELIIFLLFNSKISTNAKIGKGTYFAYGGIGCVIHERSVIGANVVIGTNITIGGRSGHYDVPTIGNNVYIATE